MDQSCCAVWAPRLTSLIRIGAGYMLLNHGTAKLLGIPHMTAFEHLHVLSLFGIAGIIELIGGALVLLGLFSRVATFITSGLGAAAYLIGHVIPLGHFFLPILTGGEAAILYSFVFFLLFLYGPGPWSLDALIRGKTA
jgi:putative oxidoreductase